MTVEQNPIQKCDEAIELVEQGLASKDEVMQALAFTAKLGELTRAIKHRFEQAAIAWIEKNGEIEEGEKRWYVGTSTRRVCKDVNETVRTILESNGPDALVRALSTNCFRPATAMEILGDQAARLFDTKVEKDLATGKPRKRLKGVPKALMGKAAVEDEEAAEAAL